MVIKSGDKVKIEYEGTLDSGEVFDSSKKSGQPLEFEIGANQVIQGFEKAVLSMEKGEEKQIKIESKEAYGDKNEELIKEIPKNQLPENLEPKVGMFLGLQTSDGKTFPAPIVEVKGEFIKIDLNHLLAGKNLNFKIKVIDVVSKE